MKAIKTIAACALFALTGAASAQDRWLGADKPRHIAASAISAVVVESLWAEDLHWLARFTIAMAPGVLKELADMRRGGSGFSGKDIAADALGVTGVMVIHGVVIRPGYIGMNWKF